MKNKQDKKDRSKQLSASVRKFIRQEKARSRREVLDKADYRKKVEELYNKFG